MATAPVLDSDVLIDYLRGRGPGWELLRQLREGMSFRVTAITAFEIAMGAEYARDPADADALLAAPCLALSRAAALRGGEVLRELRAAGEGIDVRDAMQAGICLEADLPLVTRNLRHLGRIRGLAMVEPSAWNG